MVYITGKISDPPSGMAGVRSPYNMYSLLAILILLASDDVVIWT